MFRQFSFDTPECCFYLLCIANGSDKIYLIGLPENVESLLNWIAFSKDFVITRAQCSHIVPLAIQQHRWNIQRTRKCLYSACADNGDDYNNNNSNANIVCTALNEHRKVNRFPTVYFSSSLLVALLVRMETCGVNIRVFV